MWFLSPRKRRSVPSVRRRCSHRPQLEVLEKRTLLDGSVANPISWWQAEGNANDSAGSHHGAMLAGAGFAPGRIGMAFQFDGVDDSVEIPDDPNLTTPSAITVGAWVYAESITPAWEGGFRIIVSKYNNSHDGATPGQDGQVSWDLAVDEFGRFLFVVYSDPVGSNGHAEATQDPLALVGQWQHVAASFATATQEMKIYLDGAAVPTVDLHQPWGMPITTIADSDTPIRIGRTHDNRATWDGLIDEVLLYDRALSPAEIEQVYDPVEPASLQGLVWEDFNNNGLVDLDERAIEGVAIALTGIDDRGDAVNLSMDTDAQGFFEFVNLRPGTYTLSETQPAGFADGRDMLGMVDGQPSGDDSVNDRFSQIVLPSDGVGINYNFGERPTAGGTVHAGQTATIGFWQNSNGQALLRALNTGPDSTQLGHWLAATFPNLYGAAAGDDHNLDGKSNDQIAEFFRGLFKRTDSPGGPPKLDAQALAVAFAVYVTNQDLAGVSAAAYGFQVTGPGVGYATFNVGSHGAAFGVEDNTAMTVLDILVATNARTRQGVLYDEDASGTINFLEQALREMANQVFAALNEQGHI